MNKKNSTTVTGVTTEEQHLALLGTRGIPAAYGGFETFAEELSVRLVQNGYRVTVFCEAIAGTVGPSSYKGVFLVYINTPHLGPFSTIFFDLKCLWASRRGYSIVYMLGYGASMFCFLPRLFGRRVWINMDGIEWARSKWSGVAQRYLRFCEWMAVKTPNRIIADAHGIEEHLRARHASLPDCSVIAYGSNVIDEKPPTSLLKEWNLTPGEYYIVVCRLEPENHVVEIVEGFLASNTSAPLIILGDINADTPYAASLRKLGGERARFIGTVFDAPKLTALRFYSRAYFHGHSVGGTNPSLLEAMGCGNCIVAHDNVFNREVADSSAMYFSDKDAIPEIIRELESNPVLREKMGDFAKNRIRNYYSWDRIVSQYEYLINSELN